MTVTPPGGVPGALLDALRAALAEDRADADVTARVLVPGFLTGRGSVRAKASGVIAGIDAARAVFALVDPGLRFRAHVADGTAVAPDMPVLEVSGDLRALLAAERTALNALQRASGIATSTARFVAAVSGTGARILATRKTAPGLRALDLIGVRAGGGEVHRESLADRVLMKENHLAAARRADPGATLAGVVRRLVSAVGGSVPIGVEVTDLDELGQALARGVDVVLLDNFTPDECARAVTLRRARFPEGGGPELEASGGIDLGTVRAFAATGVERISVGAVTHSAPALDLSFLIVPGDAP